ncbi:MAG: FKBP-type peptidyl-prolyl cis-trans isomerase [Candidatus Thorarchaeota archaeon]|nr:FKBP-type peptidyl-prolyl cis-trans isomerase [Candidatus Thorarchaeota archaeon]
MTEQETPKETKAKKSATKKPTRKEETQGAVERAETEGTVSKGSLIYLDYVGRTKEDGQVFDLTLEDVAKAEGIYKEDSRYEPILVAVGWNWLLGAIEDELVGMKVGESKRIEVPPEKGAGPKDPKKVKMIPKMKLAKHGVKGYVGEKVKFGQEEGVITLSVGRTCRVDFNSPLAGQTLVFDVTVRGIVSDVQEKLKAIVKRRIPILPDDKYSVTLDGDTITVELPKESRYIDGVQYAEIGIAKDCLQVHEKAKQVKVVVTFDRPEENKTSHPTEETS